MTSSRYNDYGNIMYCLDSGTARTVNGETSTDNRAIGLWRGNRSIPVIKQMFGKSEMVIRMTPYGKSSFTATFDISGHEQAINPLRKACSW